MRLTTLSLLSLLMLMMSCPVSADSSSSEGEVKQVGVAGRIDEGNFTITATLDITTRGADRSVDVVAGDVVLEKIIAPGIDHVLSYDAETRTYTMVFARGGAHRVELQLAVRAAPATDGSGWREANLALPAAQLRPIEILCDRADLEVELPGAVRVERRVVDDNLIISGLQGSREDFTVRWKPQVQELDAKLVVSTDANTIVNVSAGALSVDSLFIYQIAQGRLDRVRLKVPAALSITQVRGLHIRDWELTNGETDSDRELVVTLNRPQTNRYGLQVLAEMALPTLPAEVALPVIEPTAGIRAGGHLALGTDSAIQLVLRQPVGLSQIDAEAMPRIVLDQDHPRPLPRGKLFYYSFAAGSYQAKLALDNIVPAYDATQRVTIHVGEEDLSIDAEIELDVRDAVIREVTALVPAGFTVVAVEGAQVDDYRATATNGSQSQAVRILFREPVLGRALTRVRLEMGHTPLDQLQTVRAITIDGAASQRGYVVVAVEDGLELDDPAARALRAIHTASAPVKVPSAQYAYRFREPDWSLDLRASKKPAGIRVETFHLITLGEGVAHGSVVASYFITGSPVDRLEFVIAPQLENAQFVGRDVRRWHQDPQDKSKWTVTLQRKVIGDYNLGVTYSQRYDSGGEVIAGGVHCGGVQTEVGYLGIASHLHLKLTPQPAPDSGLLAIERDEIPANYRLLVNAPLLASYKHVAAPMPMPVTVDTYQRGALAPVVIEMVQAGTKIAPQRDGTAESFTRIRYTIKNASTQFLSLRMPTGASVWSTRLIDRDAQGREQARRVAASFDQTRGVLMIPLPRPRDPNAPFTVELEYGQAHAPGGLSGRLALAAPVADVRSTFDHWTITAPPRWAIHHAEGTMTPADRETSHGDLARVLDSVGASWSAAFRQWSSYPIGPATGLIVIAVLALVFAFARRAVLDTALAAVLVLAVWIGALAAQTPVFEQHVMSEPPMNSIDYTQVIHLDRAAPLEVDLRVLPVWRQHATVFGAIVVPVLAIMVLIGSIWTRRLRGVLIALGVTGLLYGASQLSMLTPLLGHVLTWGVPAVLLALFLWRVMIRALRQKRSTVVAAAASAVLAAVVLLPGCATTPVIEPSDAVVIERLDCELESEDDSVAGRIEVVMTTQRPMRVALLEPGTILLAVDHATTGARLVEDGGRYFVEVDRAGRHTLGASFLQPLSAADANQMRRFEMPLPAAMSARVSLNISRTGLEVRVPTAVRVDKRETDTGTHVEASLAPGDPFAVVWRPRDRRRELEQTEFFALVTSAVRFDAGLVEALHDLDFDIAQGQLTELRVSMPPGMTVTAVRGEHLGTWRYDPTTRELEAKLSRPATGQYRLHVVSQVEMEELPSEVAIGVLVIREAAQQRSALGVVASAAVDLSVSSQPQAMNADDFARDAAVLLAQFSKRSGGQVEGVRYAYRINDPSDVFVARVLAVRPEVRSHEIAGFTVEDERLIYNGQFTVTIAKAGLFKLRLAIPEGYDIDTLSAPGVSHWDESVEDGRRIATVHLAGKTLGAVTMELSMSRPISGLPDRLVVPRVEAVGSLKHTGRLVVTAERGVRLTVRQRDGISELNPADVGVRATGALAFKLLRPTWDLALQTEVVEPRVTVDFLHLARVSEGMVRHTHHLRYHLHHAGAKDFEIEVPPDAVGLLITGPNIARRAERDEASGRWRIELTGKWFDRPYPLTVQFETRFDQTAGDVSMEPVRANRADLQRGFVAVMSGDRVQLEADRVGPALIPAESRTVPRQFGAGDLSAAALCYRTTSADYDLSLKATRHRAAELLEAEVLAATITTVATEHGDTIHRVDMRMRVGSKRHLEAALPAGAEVWSLLVGGRSVVPSLTTGPSGEPLTLIPLTQTASGQLPVQVDLVYVAPAAGAFDWRRASFNGPRFDLPLRDVRWVLHVPENFEYSDFTGTLEADRGRVRSRHVARYDAQSYEAQVRRLQDDNIGKAIQLQERGNMLAVQGKQRAAKQALESAWYYSLSDEALNEDTRVQLHRLSRDQSLVGLVDNRFRLRQQAGPDAGIDAAAAQTQLGENFSRVEAERVRNSLSKADSENLDTIISHLIETQDAAAGATVPLVVQMPLRGRVLEFVRPIQVKPMTPMSVSFAAQPVAAGADHRYVWTGGLVVVLAIFFTAAPKIARRYAAARRGLARGQTEQPSAMDRV